MLRLTLLLLLCALPWAVQAQAFKCTDARGNTTYTDQPCQGGAVVVPQATPEELAADAERAAEAAARAQARDQTNQEWESARLAREQVQAEARRAASPAESGTCQTARDAMNQVAQSATASAEEQRAARVNAALACGQPAPEEPVVVWGGPRYVRPWRPLDAGDPGLGIGSRPGLRPQGFDSRPWHVRRPSTQPPAQYGKPALRPPVAHGTPSTPSTRPSRSSRRAPPDDLSSN